MSEFIMILSKSFMAKIQNVFSFITHVCLTVISKKAAVFESSETLIALNV
jgi:hypothetical protein